MAAPFNGERLSRALNISVGVRRHVGTEFVRRTIVTSDKTLVQGDFLLDDKPEIHGVATPTWRHLLYAARPNRNLKETVTWTQAREIVQKFST